MELPGLKKANPKKASKFAENKDDLGADRYDSLKRGTDYAYYLFTSKTNRWVIGFLAFLLCLFFACVLCAVIYLSGVYVWGLLEGNPNKELGSLLSTVIMIIVSTIASFLVGFLKIGFR